MDFYFVNHVIGIGVKYSPTLLMTNLYCGI